MKKTLPLRALFSYLIAINNFYCINIIKQLKTLLFLLCILTISISFSSVAKHTSPFKSAANLYSVVQDEKGFIWLSGQNGLHRFDGSQIINFSNHEKEWPTPFNWINSLSIKGEQLVIATETKGLWLFNTNTGTTTPIKVESKSNTFYRAIYHKQSFYAVSMAPQHLYRYEIATGETTVVLKDIKNNTLLSSKNKVYFNDKERLYYLDSTDNYQKTHYIKAVDEEILAAASNDDTVIMAGKNNLYKLSGTGSVTKEKTLYPISAIAISNNNQSFFTADFSGTIIKRALTTLQKEPNTFPSVDKSIYQALLHDSSGVLWLLSNRGVQQLTENTVKNHPTIFNTKYSSLETEVYNDTLYIGSYGKGVHTLSPLKKNKINAVNSINEKLSTKALKITDLFTIDNTLFIASFDGLWRYNKKKKQTQKVNLSFKNINLSNLILLKLRHNKNLLYIATDGQGLIIYDINKKKVIQHINKSMGLSSGEVIDILSLESGDIWLATALGIDVIRKNTSTVKIITNQTSAKFTSILQTDGKVFAATKGNGVFVYDQQGQLLNHFAKGINFSYMSLIDNKIYASAKPALYTINPANYQISMVTNTERYSFTDAPLSYKNSVFIANSLGILQLPKTTKSTLHPKVYISKTTVSGESYLLNKAINITSGNDVVTLDLASLDYRPGVTKKYRYTLNGNIWHQISGNQLTLTGLASGNYYIEIMATNSLGEWSNYKAYTEISVDYPWYWTPQIRWIYAVVIFCLVCFSAWLLYLRGQSIRHIHNLLQSDISNYGKNSMQVKRNLTVAIALLTENEISKSKSLLQQCVDTLNEQQKSLEPNSLNGNLLTVAIPFLAKYLQSKYQTTLFFQFELNENELEYELRADLYRVVFEAITSAILKGSGRNFKVVIQKFKNKLWLNISDDHQSFINFTSKINIDISMYYIRQIANKHKGSINTFNEQGNGSQLVLSLPIMHSH
ncbi:MAG: ligand-binding sensor domain-containing protein [Cognaticolwellia sp.]|jgi:ligand-binding sensor domain-containing protein